MLVLLGMRNPENAPQPGHLLDVFETFLHVGRRVSAVIHLSWRVFNRDLRDTI